MTSDNVIEQDATAHPSYAAFPGHLAGILLCCFCTLAWPAVAQDSAAAGVEPPVSGAAAPDVGSGIVEDDGEAPPGLRSAATDRELSRAIGNLTLYPILNVGLGYRTDVYSSDGESEDTPFVNVRAGGGVQGENRGHMYGAEYMAERIWYLNDDVEDEEEIIQRVVGYWGTAFDARNNLDLGIEYLDSYDQRGQDDPRRGIRDTVLDGEADTWEQLSYGATYVYGVPAARGRVELGTCLTCLDYNNNGQEYRDRDIFDLGATLFVQMTGRTDGFVQLVYSDFDYTDQSPDDPTGGRNLDSEEWRYMVGGSWMASERITGILRVGLVQKDFKDSTRSDNDYEEVSWDAVLNWTPTARDQVALHYFRSPREPLVWEGAELEDDFIEVEEVGLDWSHQLGQSMMVNLGGYRGWDSWKPSGRDDDLWGVAGGLRYSFAKWGSIGVSLYHRDRDSSDPAHDYSDDGVMIDFNIGSLFGFGDSRAPQICLLRGFSASSGFNGLSGY